MTGLDPNTDQIMQVCCFITDADLQLLEPSGFEAVIHHSQETLDRMSQWCVDTHGRSGLSAAAVVSTTTGEQASKQLLTYIQKYIPEKRTALLAGNSIHADRAFLSRGAWTPVVEWLHYRILDVSSLKEAARRWASDDILRDVPRKKGTHLAKDDILESIEEMKYYKNVLFSSRSG